MMNKINQNFKFTWLVCMLFYGSLQSQTLDPIIENPDVVGINKLPARASFFLYSNKKMASENDISKASNYQLLNGVWRFNWVRDSEERPKDFYKNDYDISSWKSKNILKHLFFQ